LAVRLHLKLGVVTEQDRSPDSPDTIMIVEQSVGSVARTKGHLYLLVCSRTPGPRVREATRQVAETIRNEYYYDESAGIRGCLIKTIGLANKRLAHQRDRYGLTMQDGGGPIGIAVAVVRGSELYVATVGPAEAYLIRQARLSTLPDPHRERGLPAGELEPDVWRGELTVGDSLCLVSANLVARIGTDVLKDALVTLHPQPAVEHLHGRFLAADGEGSDGAIAIEATEVAATHRTRSLVPVRPAEPLAGTPDRSPIPLADTVAGSVAALGAGATRARSAAGTFTERAVWRIQDLLPRRRTAYRRVTPATARAEAQRRAAVAVLAFVAVAASLGMGVYAFGGQREPAAAIESLSAGQQALTTAQKALKDVMGPGIDLVRDEPKKAMTLLTTAFEQLDVAAANGIPLATVDPLRKEAIASLDRLYGVVPVRSSTLFTFNDPEVPVELTAVVRGPDGAPYVLDSGSNTVWRIDLAEGKATAVVREGQKASGTTVDAPKFITVGGPDLLVVDEKNVLWRWRPANNEGKGTLVRIKVAESSSWGDDVLAIGTFVANFNAGLYRLYVVDPSEQQILNYSPASDGGGFPAKPSGRLPAARPVDGVTDLLIDGDIFTAEHGAVLRVIPAEGWRAREPGDTLLRDAPRYSRIATGTARRSGAIYAFDEVNDRLVAIAKADGAYIEQYRLAGGDRGWRDLRGMVIVPPGEEGDPFTLWWISGDRLHVVPLERVQDVPAATPRPSPTASPEDEDPSATPEGS
jgi:hypothetical protein